MSDSDRPHRDLFSSVPKAIERFRAGEIVIIVDDEDRENEGDLVIAAEKVTPEAINFMAKYGRGLICLAMTEERCKQLKLPLMVEDNGTLYSTAFTVSIEAREGVTTGISAKDRATTVLKAIHSETQPEDLIRPGHIFPVRARPGGVLKRAGHTEASVDLANLAGMNPAGVMCEIMNDDGTMARVPDLIQFAKDHGLILVSVSDLISHRLRTETLVRQVAAPRLPTIYGDFRAHGFKSDVTGEEHLAFVLGEVEPEKPILVRVHSQCLTGDIFGSQRCDCGLQLHHAMQQIQDAGRGILLYLLQEGRGIGLFNKLKAYELQEQGHDTVEANEKLGFRPDERNYGIGAQILRHLGVTKMLLMTNNPGKYIALDGYGLEIVERIPLEIPPSESSHDYLRVKREKMGHMLKLV